MRGKKEIWRDAQTEIREQRQGAGNVESVEGGGREKKGGGRKGKKDGEI